jgi:hypothetical protein
MYINEEIHIGEKTYKFNNTRIDLRDFYMKAFKEGAEYVREWGFKSTSGHNRFIDFLDEQIKEGNLKRIG